MIKYRKANHCDCGHCPTCANCSSPVEHVIRFEKEQVDRKKSEDTIQALIEDLVGYTEAQKNQTLYLCDICRQELASFLIKPK